MTFGLTVAFKEYLDVTNSHPVTFSAACAAECHRSCFWWHAHLCTRHLPLSAKGNLSWQSCLKCVELEAVLDIIYIQLIETALLSWEVKLCIMCVHSQASLASPTPLLSSTVPAQGGFCPVCWSLMYFHKAPCAMPEKHMETCKGIS